MFTVIEIKEACSYLLFLLDIHIFNSHEGLVIASKCTKVREFFSNKLINQSSLERIERGFDGIVSRIANIYKIIFWLCWISIRFSQVSYQSLLLDC